MENKIITYLTFKIGSETFAANVKNIHSIIEYTKLTKVPEMPSFIIGIINLQGEVLPIIDSRIKLGIPATEATTSTSIVVIDLNIDGINSKVGLLVDEVSDVIEIEDLKIEKAPATGIKFSLDIVTGVFHDGEKFILLIDILKLVVAGQILSKREE